MGADHETELEEMRQRWELRVAVRRRLWEESGPDEFRRGKEDTDRAVELARTLPRYCPRPTAARSNSPGGDAMSAPTPPPDPRPAPHPGEPLPPTQPEPTPEPKPVWPLSGELADCWHDPYDGPPGTA